LKEKSVAALAIYPTRYVLSSKDCALSTIELGTTREVVKARLVVL
jgi:hypothetical protein